MANKISLRPRAKIENKRNSLMKENKIKIKTCNVLFHYAEKISGTDMTEDLNKLCIQIIFRYLAVLNNKIRN